MNAQPPQIAGNRFSSNSTTERLPFLGVVVLAVLVVLALRLINLGPSFNVFIDEITYLYLSQSAIANGSLTAYGQTFYLHPPAYFFMQGAYLQIFQPAGGLIEQIYMARTLNLTFAALSAAALIVFTYRLSGWCAAALAVGLFALDPFIIRMNSLAMLDTPAMAWVMLGYAIIVLQLSSRRNGVDQDQQIALPTWAAVLAGLSFGLGILTKDSMALLTLLPLLACYVLNWVLTRRSAILVGITASLTYLPYLVTVVAVGEWSRFAEQKFSGILRLAGVFRTTGLNRPDGPSLVNRVIERLGEFGPTYMVIALGAVALVVLLRRRDSLSRLVGLWLASAYLLLGYCIVIGTIEEQFFYWLVVAAVSPVAMLLVAMLRDGLQVANNTLRTGLRAVPVACLLLFASWSSVQWVRVHFTPDNAYEQAIAFLQQNAQAGNTVASTSETGQFLLQPLRRASGPWGNWTSQDALTSYRPNYLLISTLQLEWDSPATARQLQDWANQNGQLVFEFAGQRNNRLLLYALPAQQPVSMQP